MNIIVNMPQTEQGMKRLRENVADAHAELMIKKLGNTPMSKENKKLVLDKLINYLDSAEKK